jgi:hypothetical protein
VPPKSVLYSRRPSISTSSLLAIWSLKPRAEMAQFPEFKRATESPGTMRSASMIVVAPERRMSSWVRTYTAAAESPTCCALRLTEVTSIWIDISSSSDMTARFSKGSSSSGSSSTALCAVDGAARRATPTSAPSASRGTG